jgi:beta-galactosidase
MTAKRETTGSAAKLAMMADRTEIFANGEDVAMVAVEVLDAQGRVVPVADNEVAFRISGQGKLIGVGNGDPTSHESDIGNSRKAFSGLCMAIVQSAKTAGSIVVEASSPGLTPASATIATRSVMLRPQVASWEREVPAGPGITGLWRPVPVTSATGGGGRRGGGQVFTFRQNGTVLTGAVEGGAGGRGDEAPVAIDDGKVDGANVTFRAGSVTYRGTLKGEQIELQQTGAAGGGGREGDSRAAASGPRPAIGPPPDGSDPSRPAFYYGLADGGRQGAATPPPLVLVRAKR